MDLFKNLKLNKKYILIVGIIGVALMMFNGGKKEENIYMNEEKKLVSILSDIDGVGKVKVMLTVNEETTSVFSEESTSKYIGAIILAEGGEKSSIKEKIIKAVNAVTGLDAHKIVVYKLDV